MKKEKKNQNLIHYGFTLIEMIIVLIIIGIMLLVTLYMSGEQIQKVKDKTVKEAIVAEMQSRYSRNLGSSSFAGEIYDTMHVELDIDSNNINFKYTYKDKLNRENTFVDMFEVKYIGMDYDFTGNPPTTESGLNLEYNPYKLSCKVGNNRKSATIITRVNDHKNYCFEINEKNCRLTDISTEKCEKIAELTNNNL